MKHVVTHLFLTALLVPIALAACGDDTTRKTNCGAGTVLVNGECVVESDTNVPTDTSFTDTFQANDATSVTDTLQVFDSTGSDTSGPTTCTPEEAGTVLIGGGCTRDCQCSQSEGGSGNFCYSGTYMEGFSFCTRTFAQGGLDSNLYDAVSYSLSCFAPGTFGEGDRVFMRECASLQDCKALSSQYTDCGTAALGYSGERGTICSRLTASNCATATLMSAPTCIIRTLSPFKDSITKCSPK